MSGYNTLEGVYYIINKASGTMIDLPDNLGSKAVGWSLGLIKPGLYDHQHWLIRQDGQGQTFTIQNIGNGKMLELAQGSNSNGLQASCSPRDLKNDRVRTSQEWLLKEQNGGWYILQNSKSRTVLEIASGSSANRAAVQGWDYNQAKEEQLWHLERRSKTPAEIVNILCNTPPFRPNGEGIQRINVGPPGKPIEYVTLLDGFRTQIFLEAGLLGQGLAQRGYDQHMNFAEKTQEAIATKGGQRIRVPGVAVLIGIVEGNVAGEQDTRVYNWYLTQDLCTVVFLDARTGREYTARGLDLEGFQPTKVYY